MLKKKNNSADSDDLMEDVKTWPSLADESRNCAVKLQLRELSDFIRVAGGCSRFLSLVLEVDNKGDGELRIAGSAR